MMLMIQKPTRVELKMVAAENDGDEEQ